MIYALILARVALTAVAGVNNATLANIAAVRYVNNLHTATYTCGNFRSSLPDTFQYSISSV